MAKKIPVALTIAGSDSGGGAGIQADLKTFAALGVHGTSVITCLTAQNPKRLLAVKSCLPGMLRLQLDAIFQELPPAAIKTGMLYSAANIKLCAQFLRRRISRHHISLVVDPVLVSTSGTKLLQPAALTIFMEQLLPLATIVTPNLSEAEILSGQKIDSVDTMHDAALKIHARWDCAVLVKGGHLRGSSHATDVFFDGKETLALRAPFIKNIPTHGTGCVYSAAICATLAQKKSLRHAVQIGKEFITHAIVNSRRIGNHFVLGT